MYITVHIFSKRVAIYTDSCKQMHSYALYTNTHIDYSISHPLDPMYKSPPLNQAHALYSQVSTTVVYLRAVSYMTSDMYPSSLAPVDIPQWCQGEAEQLPHLFLA